jgi:diguanylate cyclase (GGDEF)-like protein
MSKKLTDPVSPVSIDQERVRPRTAFAGRGALDALVHSEAYTFAMEKVTSCTESTDIRDLLRLVPECFRDVSRVEIIGENFQTPLVSAFVKEDKVIFSGSGDGEHLIRTTMPLVLKDGAGKRKIGEMHVLSVRPLSLDSEQPNDWYETKKVLEFLSAMMAKTMDAKLDGLTALPMRKYFDIALREQADRYRKEGRQFSLITLDIDFFKRINDEFGHDAGDKVLATIARLLYNKIRSRADCTDRVYRTGGEEFGIILPGIQGVNAFRVAERLREIINNYDFGLGKPVSCSFGVAEISEVSGENADKELYKLADKRMYEAKDGGRNSVVPGQRISQRGMKAVKPGG